MITVKQFDNNSSAWDNFVSSANNGTLFHTRRFLSYHPEGRFNDHSLEFYKKGKLVGVFPAAIVETENGRTLVSHPGASVGSFVVPEDLAFADAMEMVNQLVEYSKRENFDRAFPLLSEIGYKILYCGKLGNASTLKVVTNYLASINLLSLGEALMVCKKYGLDLTTTYHGIRISSGNSFVHETESKVILNGSYDVGFTMDLACKDLGLFDKLVDKYNIPAKISKLMNKIFTEGKTQFGDRSLSTSIVKRLEELCNENLRAPGFPSQLTDEEPKKKGIEIKYD